MGLIRRLARAAAERLAIAPSEGAAEQFDLRATMVEVQGRWTGYVDRNAIRTPVIHDVAWFLWTEYRLPMPDEDIAHILGHIDCGVVVKMDAVLPRLAFVLLESGVLAAERR